MSNPLKPIVSNTRILFSLLPGLGAMIVIRMAIHLYRPDIEDADHRVRDYPFDKLHNCYDFIIIGGGSAGAVLANRLSENPEWSVLLLEAGSDENVLSEVPVLFPALQTSSIDWQFATEPSDGYCLSMVDKRCKWPRGKVLGGSSVLNAMLYIRGNKRDYDYWAELGNIGWSYQDVLPYFLKSEGMKIPEYQNDPYHSTSGPLTVEYFKYEHPITRKILEAGQQFGYNILDVNGEYQTGFTRSHATVREGLRCSTAKAFLRPVCRRPNLHISLESLVEKILIDEYKQAYGVKFSKHGHQRIIKARREVILSAGAIQSPQILMLSGIGEAEHMKEFGIHPVVHLPGVGQNLQDHVAMGGHSFLFDNPYDNGTDYCFNIQGMFSLGTLIDFAVLKQGAFYTMMEAEAMAFINTKYQEAVDQNYPDIQLFIAPTADNMDGGLFGKRANGLTDETYAELYEDILYESSFSIVPLLLRPKSRGYIKLQDTNPLSPPKIYANYYSHPDDMKIMIEGARLAQKIVEQPALRELNARPNPSRNPGCGEHPLMSDEHLECQARHHTLTIYHPVGTCAMGPADDPQAVVDPRLRVYGINNLRIVDGSIMPTIVNGNTNAPIIMIAEKASDMIKEDWSEASDDKLLTCTSYYRTNDNATNDLTKVNDTHLPSIPPANIRIDFINGTANQFPNFATDNLFKTPLISKSPDGTQERAKKDREHKIQATSKREKDNRANIDILPTNYQPDVYPDQIIPTNVEEPPAYIEPPYPLWPFNIFNNQYSPPKNPFYRNSQMWTKNRKPSPVNLWKPKPDLFNRRFNKKYNRRPNCEPQLTHEYILNGRKHMSKGNSPYYYSPDMYVTSKREGRCRIWLYHDGTRYNLNL